MTWREFAAVKSRLAELIHNLFFQYGPGLGYLATVRPDGGPRIHPVSPVVVDGQLYCFLVDSPKRRDLERDGRYALHAFPPESTEDEAYLAGVARCVTDPARVRRVASAVHAEPRVDWELYEFGIDVAMVVCRADSPTATISDPTYERYVWRAPTAAAS